MRASSCDRSLQLACVAALVAATAGGCGDEDDASPPDAGALASYVIPGEESMAAIAIDGSTGEFFVNSAASGKLYHGFAGTNVEVTLDLFADLTSAGISRGGHIAVTPNGARLVMASGFGDAPKVHVIDLASKTLLRTVAIPTAGSGGFAALQDVAISPDSARAYVSNPFENTIAVVDLSSFETSSFPISPEFPYIANANQGFINATGLAVAPDGTYLVVAHIIDKHLYRVSLAPSSLGQARQIDTAPYNISGNGLWLGPEGDLLEVAGDELRIFRFSLNGDATAGPFQARYQSDAFEQGMTYAVAYDDRILVLNGNGVSLGNGGGGAPGGGGGGTIPPELVMACAGKAAGDACSATLNGSSLTGTCTDSGGTLACIPSGGLPGGGGPGTGTGMQPKLPIRVLQLQR